MMFDGDLVKVLVWTSILTFCTFQWFCAIVGLREIISWIGG